MKVSADEAKHASRVRSQHHPRNFYSNLAFLSGEREAFALALEIEAMGVLLDDRAAMVEAQRHNIPTIPTFTLLEQAAAQDLIDLPQAVAAMRQTSFRLPPEAEIDAMIERDRKRKQTS